MNNIIIIHGIGGLNRENYFPHLKSHCEKLGLNVIMPSFGGYRDETTYEKWKINFDQNYKKFLNKDTIVMSQSIGTQFIVKYLAEQKTKIGLYISCAGPYNATYVREEVKEHKEHILLLTRLSISVFIVMKFNRNIDFFYNIFRILNITKS